MNVKKKDLKILFIFNLNLESKLNNIYTYNICQRKNI